MGRQVEEVIRAHTQTTGSARKALACTALAAVGLEGARFYRAAAHELSGGERQRVVIAQALSAQPSLLIADEPTSSLDTLAESDILSLLQKLRTRFGYAMLFITHNPALLGRFTDRILLVRDNQATEANLLAHVAQL